MAELTTDIKTARTALAAGGVVAFPTETVYGLGALADNEVAVKQVFTFKGRPREHPLIIHIEEQKLLEYWAAEVPELAHQLAKQFWPGPLTLVLPRKQERGEIAAGGRANIALRMPAHPIAQELITNTTGLVAPSANKFGRPSPTTAQHVLDEFSNEDILIFDGGATEYGIESTVIELATSTPRLLRPGVIPQTQIESITGPLELATNSGDAPGTLANHYAPRQPVILLSKEQFAQCEPSYAALGFIQPAQVNPENFRQLPTDPTKAAHQLFSLLRELEATNTEKIAIEQPPNNPQWATINDRLKRAAQPN